MSCIQQNFPSKFEPYDAFYEKLEQNTFVAFILRHPVPCTSTIVRKVTSTSTLVRKISSTSTLVTTVTSTNTKVRKVASNIRMVNKGT